MTIAGVYPMNQIKIEPELSELYWAEYDSERNEYHVFSQNKKLMPIGYGTNPDDIVLVLVTISPNQVIDVKDYDNQHTYSIYGWIDQWRDGYDGHITLIQPTWSMFSVQFEYGVLKTVDADRGYPVRLEVRQVDPDDPEIQKIDFDNILN